MFKLFIDRNKIDEIEYLGYCMNCKTYHCERIHIMVWYNKYNRNSVMKSLCQKCISDKYISLQKTNALQSSSLAYIFKTI